MNLNGGLDAQGPFRPEGIESGDEVATTQRAKGGRQERVRSCAGGVASDDDDFVSPSQAGSARRARTSQSSQGARRQRASQVRHSI